MKERGNLKDRIPGGKVDPCGFYKAVGDQPQDSPQRERPLRIEPRARAHRPAARAGVGRGGESRDLLAGWVGSRHRRSAGSRLGGYLSTASGAAAFCFFDFRFFFSELAP